MENTNNLISFNLLFKEYHLRFVAYANSYVRDRSAAEDLVTESFLVFWENQDKLAVDSNAPAYVLTVLKNKCLNYLHRQEIEQKALASIHDHQLWELNLRITSLEASNPEELFCSDLEKTINDAILKLPSKTQKVFKMSRLEFHSNKEIAEFLGISQKGVEFHITKALTQLRKLLKDQITVLVLIIFSLFKSL